MVVTGFNYCSKLEHKGAEMTPEKLRHAKVLEHQIKSAEALIEWIEYADAIRDPSKRVHAYVHRVNMVSMLQDNIVDEFLLADTCRGGLSWLRHNLDKDRAEFEAL